MLTISPARNPEQRIEVYEYTRQVFGEKNWSICANYALHLVAKDNAKDEENFVKAIQRNFYMNDFLKSVRTAQESIEIYQKVKEILSKGGFNLTKWIVSDEKLQLWYGCTIFDKLYLIISCPRAS